MKNREVAGLFEKMADMLEFKERILSRFGPTERLRGFLETSRRTSRRSPKSGNLKDIPGIGEGMAEKIEEYLKTGKVSKFEEARKGVSDELIAIMNIPGMGPKTLSMFHKEKGIDNLCQLEKALENGSLSTSRGWGKKRPKTLRAVFSF